MGIEDDFYATIKLVSGEEIFARVAASEEEDRTVLLLSSPITIGEIKNRMGVIGYKVEPWLKTTKDDLFVITMDKVLTISETTDIEMINLYQRFVRDSVRDDNPVAPSKLSREMGLLGNIDETKKKLEKLFKSS
jgi:predicted transcriptional regulator